MKRFLIGGILATMIVQAQEIKKRQENQQDRIAQGVGSGQLTPRETARLEHREANLNGPSARIGGVAAGCRFRRGGRSIAVRIN